MRLRRVKAGQLRGKGYACLNQLKLMCCPKMAAIKLVMSWHRLISELDAAATLPNQRRHSLVAKSTAGGKVPPVDDVGALVAAHGSLGTGSIGGEGDSIPAHEAMMQELARLRCGEWAVYPCRQ
jgi:hypothetical protein